MEEADLHDAKLSHANLQDADLEDAELADGVLTEANLLGTNLYGAILGIVREDRAEQEKRIVAMLAGTCNLERAKWLEHTHISNCTDRERTRDLPISVYREVIPASLYEAIMEAYQKNKESREARGL